LGKTLQNPLLLSPNSKVCILRLSAIGDVCHAAAMVNRIQKYRPDIELTWVIGKIEYELMKGMAGVRFVIFDKKAGRAGIKAVKSALSSIEFDVLCVMQVALRANWLSRGIRAKVRLGFDKARSKEGHSLFINHRIAPQEHAHVLNGFMAFADAMGIAKAEAPEWTIPLTTAEEEFGQQLASTLGHYAVISPAASKAERNWTPAGYAAVVDHLAQQHIAVVLCGGPGALDKALAQDIMGLTQGVSQSLVGKTTLKQQLSVIKYAQVVIAPDTGPAHMATTVHTPVVGLYAHSNPLRTGPFNNLTEVVSVYPECIEAQYQKTWQDLPWGIRAKGDGLMTKIPVKEVLTQVDRVLEQK
jgi:heptosyltransferase I